MTSTRVKIRIFFNDNSEGVYYVPNNMSFDTWSSLILNVGNNVGFIYLIATDNLKGEFEVLINSNSIVCISKEN